MARIEDIPQPTRDAVLAVPCPQYGTTPFVTGPALQHRRIAILSSAALIPRGDSPFAFGSAEVRLISREVSPNDLLISHVSINFDRTGFQRDVNVVFPLDRLRELADEGVIGGVADTQYTVMGSTDPAGMEEAADTVAERMRAEGADSLLLAPV
jgi:D-proline reductase (dithiol) PrdB